MYKLLMAAVAALALVQPVEAKTWKEIFPNMQVKEWRTLFAGHVLVADRTFGKSPLGIAVLRSDGASFFCFAESEGGRYFWEEARWEVTVRELEESSTRFPFFWNNLSDGTRKGGIYRYNAKDGTYKMYGLFDKVWHYRESGHVQREIPAVVYEICPGFPSAAELGLPLNEKQTATTYKALVKQDPGDRVMDPSLEAGGDVYQRLD